MNISCATKQIAFKRCQANWGGATLNVRTEEFVANDYDGYAYAISDTVSVCDRVTFAEFASTLDKVVNAWLEDGDVSYIGFFHDNTKGTIDINVAFVVDSKSKVDEAFDMGIKMLGGAYHFLTGNGYWPQGRPEEYK